MANNIPFQPMGNCVVATAASANVQGVVVAITAVSPVNQYFVFNVVAIAPYAEKTFTGPQVSPTKTVYARIIAPHNNAELYITPGEGL